MKTLVKIGDKPFRLNFDPTAFEAVKSAFDASSRVGIACSGGADSLFLLLAMAYIWREKKDRLYVLHFNHMARPTSGDDEKFVENISRKLGLQFVSGRPKSSPEKKSENEFRKMRMKFFSSEFFSKKLDFIVQGHHAGDVAETVLMRLMRGAGLDGLCAPHPISEIGGVKFVRPMLPFGKKFITSALKEAGFDWMEDESNAQSDFFRNKIRNGLIGEIGKICPSDFVVSACRSRNLLQEDADFIGEILRNEIRTANPDFPAGEKQRLILSDKILSASSLLRRSVLLLLARNEILSSMRSDAVDSFVGKLLKRPKNPVKTSCGNFFVCYEPRDNSISIHPCSKAEDFLIPLQIGKNKLPCGLMTLKRITINPKRLEEIKSGDNNDDIRAFLDLSAAGTFADYALCARSPEDGDAYPPLGSRSPKKLKNIFNAKKIPSMKRKSLPLVCNRKGEIVWIPMLPPSNIYRLTNSSAAIELTYEPF